jgi:hypothetical protein
MATMASDRALPEIKVDPTNKPYFDAVREGRLLIGLCKDTGRHFWYPRGCSPFTLSNNVELVEAKGHGHDLLLLGDAHQGALRRGLRGAGRERARLHQHRGLRPRRAEDRPEGAGGVQARRGEGPAATMFTPA